MLCVRVPGSPEWIYLKEQLPFDSSSFHLIKCSSKGSLVVLTLNHMVIFSADDSFAKVITRSRKPYRFVEIWKFLNELLHPKITLKLWTFARILNSRAPRNGCAFRLRMHNLSSFASADSILMTRSVQLI